MEINCYDALQIIILSLGVFSLLRFPILHLCAHVSYVTFNTDLNLYSKKKTLSVSTQGGSTPSEVKTVVVVGKDLQSDHYLFESSSRKV